MLRRTGTTHMKRRGKRDPLPKIKVGSGITEKNRKFSLLDPPYRDRYLAGGLVDARLRKFPDEPFQEVLSRSMNFAMQVYKEAGLRSPFVLRHPNGSFTELDGLMECRAGADALKHRMDKGYRFNAELEAPAFEDHSKLWYASILALAIIRLELLKVRASDRINSGEDTPAELVELGAHVGATIGSLDAEVRIKFAHEADAVRGKTTLAAAAKGGDMTAAQNAKGKQQRIEQIEKLIQEGKSVSRAAELVAKSQNKTKHAVLKEYQRHEKKKLKKS